VKEQSRDLESGRSGLKNRRRKCIARMMGKSRQVMESEGIPAGNVLTDIRRSF
jgi:hypothetical protein